MVCHFQHALPRDMASAQHMLQKGQHIVWPLWATERDHEERVIRSARRLSRVAYRKRHGDRPFSVREDAIGGQSVVNTVGSAVR